MPIVPVVPCQSTCTPWATPADICQPCSGLTLDAQLLLDMLQAASDILFELSGRQFAGSCQDTVRPLPRQVATDHGRPIRPPWPYGYAAGYFGPYMGLAGGAATGYVCNRTEDAGCTALPQVDLGVYPLTGIVQVLVDGVVVDPSTYEIHDNRHLVRLADPTSTNNFGWPCFPAGTLVLTSTGLKPIETIEIGENVLTHMNRWRTVTRAGKTGDSETVLVKGQGGTVRCTPDHQFWAADLTSQSRTPNPRLVKPQRNGRWMWKLGAPQWTTADQLVGKVWASPTRVDRLPIPLPEKWTDSDLPDNFWWVIGRWVGDGWTSNKGPTGKRGGGSSAVMICAGKHEADDLGRCLADTGWVWRRRTQETSVRFRFCDPALRAWLRTYFGTSAATKRLPAWLLGADQETRERFMAGYLSADGHEASDCSHSPYQMPVTVSRELAIGIRLLAITLGFAPGLARRTQKTNQIEDRSASGRDRFDLRWNNAKVGAPYLQAWADPLHLWGRVKSVCLDETVVPVYDLEVDQDRSFVADGFVVHNCCSRLDLPNTAKGTFEVTFTYGVPPPVLGVRAAAELGCQLALACTPSAEGACRLPKRITSITRQGVSAVVLDPWTFFEQGLTGLYICDAFLIAKNPEKIQRRATVTNVDLGKRVRRRTV